MTRVLVETHVFGSHEGYTTRAKSPGVNQDEEVELTRFGFSQTSDAECLRALHSHPTAYGRALPGRSAPRFAITRVFPGPLDVAGRVTLEFRSILLDAAAYHLCRGGIGRLLLDHGLWGRTEFHAGVPLTIPTPQMSAPAPNEDSWRLFNSWFRAKSLGAAVVADERMGAGVIRLAGQLDPVDAMEYAWGINLLNPVEWVDVLTLSKWGSAAQSSRRLFAFTANAAWDPRITAVHAVSPHRLPSINSIIVGAPIDIDPVDSSQRSPARYPQRSPATAPPHRSSRTSPPLDQPRRFDLRNPIVIAAFILIAFVVAALMIRQRCVPTVDLRWEGDELVLDIATSAPKWLHPKQYQVEFRQSGNSQTVEVPAGADGKASLRKNWETGEVRARPLDSLFKVLSSPWGKFKQIPTKPPDVTHWECKWFDFDKHEAQLHANGKPVYRFVVLPRIVCIDRFPVTTKAEAEVIGFTLDLGKPEIVKAPVQEIDRTQTPFDHSVTICVSEGKTGVVRVKPTKECKLMYGTEKSDAKAAEAKPGSLTFEFPWEGPLKEQWIRMFSSAWLPNDKKLEISLRLQRTPIRLDITPDQRLLLLDAPPKDSNPTLQWTISLDKKHSLDTTNQWVIRSLDPSWSQPTVTPTKVKEGTYTIKYPAKEAPIGEYWPEPDRPDQITWKTPPKYSIQVYQLPTPPTPIVTPTPDVLQVAWQPPPNASLSIDLKTTVEWRSGPPGSDSDWKLLVVGGDTPLHDFPAERDNEYEFRVKWEVLADGKTIIETTSKPSEKAKLSGQCITDTLFKQLQENGPIKTSGESESDDSQAPQTILQDLHAKLGEAKAMEMRLSTDKSRLTEKAAKNVASKVDAALKAADDLEVHPPFNPKERQTEAPPERIDETLSRAIATTTDKDMEQAIKAWRKAIVDAKKAIKAIRDTIEPIEKSIQRAEKQAKSEWCKKAQLALEHLSSRANKIKRDVDTVGDFLRQKELDLTDQCGKLESKATSLRAKVAPPPKIQPSQLSNDIERICDGWRSMCDAISEASHSVGGAP